MKSAIAAAMGVLVASLIAGCSVQVKMNESNETDMGSHHVTVKPGGGLASSSSAVSGDVATYKYSCGDTSVIINNEELVVNNVSYGKLAAGEAVLIDQGKVSVAGKPRQGTAMSDEELSAAGAVKETTKTLAGYDVTVRPGSPSSFTMQLLGKHTLTVGGTSVSIKKNELSVNDKSYGQLKAGDVILVENKTVSVSGKIRQAKR